MSATIVIASQAGRNQQTRRAVEAYRRETPGDPQIIVALGEQIAEAWRIGVAAVAGEIVHFGIDTLEPHPGWFEAASAACRSGLIPSPTVWTTDGVELVSGLRVPGGGRDWSSALGSEFPTMTFGQLRIVGAPPIAAEAMLPFVFRSRYAFTRHGD